MSVETFTDVSQLVDSVFKDMDCVASGYGGCRGERAAYLIAHTCLEGLICEAHLKNWVHVHKTLTGPVECTACGRHFSCAREMAQVYPL